MTDIRSIRREALAEAVTIEEMAQVLGVPARTLRGRAERLGVGRVIGGVRVLLPEDGLVLGPTWRRGPKARGENWRSKRAPPPF